MKLVKTDLYLLLIDEEAKIKPDDYIIHDTVEGIVEANDEWDYRGEKDDYWNKAIAYRKLNENAKELNLPLLPNPFKSNYKHPFYALLSAIDILKSDGFDERCDVLVHLEETKNFIQNVMQSKQFSLEDMKKAIEMAKEGKLIFNSEEYGFDFKYTREEIIQSLSTQQLPKEFIPEIRIINQDYRFERGQREELKTITNPEGKKELVGKYLY